VVKGKWDKESAEEVSGIEKEVNSLFMALRGKDAEETLDKFAAFDKKHPALSKIPYFTGPKIGLMLQAKKTDDAKKFAEKILEGAVKSDDTSAMQTVSTALRAPNAKTNKDLMALSLKAAEAMAKAAGDKDMYAMYNMAETQFAAGNKAKAVEYGQKAVDAADNPNNKKFLEARLKAYDETKKDEKDEKKKDEKKKQDD
jgi:hypothetical protein